MYCYCFITDNNSKDYTQIAIRSLLEHNPKYDVIVYTYQVKLDIQGVIEIPIHDLDNLEFSIKQLTVKNLPILAYRLKMLDSLKKHYSKIMFLDTDMIFLENIDYLFSFSDSRILGRDELLNHLKARKELGNPLWYNTDIYLNSGLLVIPSSLIQDHNLYNEFLEELRKRSESYICPEQDFINYTFKDKLQDIGCYFNCFINNISKIDLQKVRVVHYCGKGKPTRIQPVLMSASKVFFDLFEMYLERYKDCISNDFYHSNKEALKGKDFYG